MTTTPSKQQRRPRGAGALLAALVAAVALLAATGTASAGIDRAYGNCWKDVVNDWLQHQPNVVGTYPIACYTQAIQHLDAYPDIQQYSSAPDDIHRALLAALHNSGGGPGPGSSGGGGGAGGSGGSSAGGGGGSSGSSGGGGATTTATPSKSFVTRLFDAVGPGDAQSVPLPLLVLAGLAGLLLLAAAATWVTKRIQARPQPLRATRQSRPQSD